MDNPTTTTSGHTPSTPDQGEQHDIDLAQKIDNLDEAVASMADHLTSSIRLQASQWDILKQVVLALPGRHTVQLMEALVNAAVGSSGKATVSAATDADGDDVVHLTPQEGRPYVRSLPVDEARELAIDIFRALAAMRDKDAVLLARLLDTDSTEENEK